MSSTVQCVSAEKYACNLIKECSCKTYFSMTIIKYLNFTSQVKCCDCSGKTLDLVDPPIQSYKGNKWNKLITVAPFVNLKNHNA